MGRRGEGVGKPDRASLGPSGWSATPGHTDNKLKVLQSGSCARCRLGHGGAGEGGRGGGLSHSRCAGLLRLGPADGQDTWPRWLPVIPEGVISHSGTHKHSRLAHFSL